MNVIILPQHTYGVTTGWVLEQLKWHMHFCSYCYIVSGEANFVMDHTSLNVGGFTQPSVARSLIELPSNIEKGLSTRFVWIFPKPCYAKFASLEPVNQQFTTTLGRLQH